jgi:hypothetical protein
MIENHAAPRPLARLLMVVMLAVVSVSLSSCIDTTGLTEPTIVNLIIEPDTITTSEQAMSNEFFTATIEVANFADPPTGAEIFIQDPEVTAVPGDTTINGNTIVLSEIQKSWFEGLSTGTYNIGATVTSETESVTQLDLETVTVTE